MAKYYHVGIRDYINPENDQHYWRYREPRSVAWVSWLGALEDLEKKLLTETNERMRKLDAKIGEIYGCTLKPEDPYTRVVFYFEQNCPGILW